MSFSDDQLRQLLKEDAAAATPAQADLDARGPARRAGRRRMRSAVATALASAALLTILAVSLGSLLPLGEDKVVPAGPAQMPVDLSDRVVVPPSDVAMEVYLPGKDFSYPNNWTAVAKGAEQGDSEGASTLQVANFDTGFDADVCLAGGASVIPSQGVVLHVGTGKPPVPLDLVATLPEMRTNGASVPITCDGATAYATAEEGNVWMVVVAAPQASGDAVQAAIDSVMQGTTSYEDPVPSSAIPLLQGSATAPMPVTFPNVPAMVSLVAPTKTGENPRLAVCTRAASLRDAAQQNCELRPTLQPAPGMIAESISAYSVPEKDASLEPDGWTVAFAGLADRTVTAVSYTAAADEAGPVVERVVRVQTVPVPDSMYSLPVNVFGFAVKAVGDTFPSGVLTVYGAGGAVVQEIPIEADFPAQELASGSVAFATPSDPGAPQRDLAAVREAALAFYAREGSYSGLTPDVASELVPGVRICFKGQQCEYEMPGMGDAPRVLLLQPFEDSVTLSVSSTPTTWEMDVTCVLLSGDSAGEEIALGVRQMPTPANCTSDASLVPPDMAETLLQRGAEAVDRWRAEHDRLTWMSPAALREWEPSVPIWCDSFGGKNLGFDPATECAPTATVDAGKLWPPPVVITYAGQDGVVLTVLGREMCAAIGDGPTRFVNVEAITLEGCSQATLQDKEAQGFLRNALAAAKVLFTDTDSYERVDVQSLRGVEPSLTYTNETNAKPLEVSLRDLSAQTILLVVRSKSGHVYCLADDGRKGTTYGTADALTMNECADRTWPPTGVYP